MLAQRTFGGGRRLRNPPSLENPPTLVPSSIVIAPTPFNVTTSGTTQLTATVYDQFGQAYVGATVSWSTSAAGVATVNSAGLVTGVGVGSCSITAAVVGYANVTSPAACTVSAPTVVSLDVTPSSLLVNEGGATGSLTFTPRDAGGNAIAGKTVTGTSDAAGTATISLAGYTGTVSGVAAGATNVHGTCDGVDSPDVAVTVQSASLYGNRPAACTTQVWGQQWDVVPGTTYAAISGGVGYCRKESGGAAIITDAAGPISPSNVLRTRFNASLAGGTAPVSLEGWRTSGYSDVDEFDEVYWTGWLKIGDAVAGFQLHNTLQKMGFFGHAYTAGQGARNESFLFLNGSGNTTTNPASIVTSVTYRWQQQGPAGSSTLNNHSANMNVGSATVGTGTWHRLEIALGINTIGSANGTLKMWRDGTQIMNHANIEYRTATYPKAFWWYKWNPTYGGGTGTGNTRSQVDDILIDHVEIWGG